jgi:molybdopterin-guanine dinucleotide biosynthesis protein A
MSPFIKNCTGVILAGGENTRMPVTKAFIKVEGKTIIERSLDIYRQLFRNIFIITDRPELYSRFNVRMLGDIYDIRGPMTGIFTSMINSEDPWIFVSACDMPCLNKDVITFMASVRNGHEAVVPFYKGGPEPLHAFYSVRLASSMEKSLSGGDRALKDFLRSKKVKYLSFRELTRFDPGAKSMINLNTPLDIRNFINC